MERDFTEEQKDTLKRLIDEINDEQLLPITDIFGDLWAEIVSVAAALVGLDYFSCKNATEKYFKRVLDAKDTTKEQIDEIFENVHTVDDEHKVMFDTYLGQIERAATVMNGLTAFIDPNGDNFMKGNVLRDLDATFKEFSANMKKVNTYFDSSLDYIYTKLKEDTVKNFVKGCINFVFDATLLVGCAVTGNAAGFAHHLYGVINDGVMMNSQVSALSGITSAKEMSNRDRYKSISGIKEDIDTEDLGDLIDNKLGDSTGGKVLGFVVDVADYADAGYSICHIFDSKDGVANVFDKVGDVEKFWDVGSAYVFRDSEHDNSGVRQAALENFLYTGKFYYEVKENIVGFAEKYDPYFILN